MAIIRRATLWVIGSAALVLSSCTLEQVLLGAWYNFSTNAAGSCPVLGWHFVVDAQRQIGGYLDRDTWTKIATLSGRLNQDDTFEMTATQVGGSKTERITGAFTSQYVEISLDGTWICGKQTFKIRPIRSVGGGGGGGGG
jgi:hypothetical protein